MVAAAAAGATRSHAVPCVNTSAPLPSLSFVHPIEYAFDEFLNLGGVGGAGRTLTPSGAALYARQEVWDDIETNGASLLRSDALFDAPHAPPTRVWHTKRDAAGAVVGFGEESSPSSEWWRGNISTIASSALGAASGSASSSLLRPLANRSIASTGSTNFVPFRPGGLDDIEPPAEEHAVPSDDPTSDSALAAIMRSSLADATLHSLFPWDYPLPGRAPAVADLLSCPPGFERGLRSTEEVPHHALESAVEELTLASAPALAAQKAREAAMSASAAGSGTKLPSVGATVAPYVAGVNDGDTLANVSASFSADSYEEYRASVRKSHQAQLARTELKIRHISEEVDESLFEDEDYEEHAQRVAEKVLADTTAEENDPHHVNEEDLLAELDLTLPSAQALKAQTAAAAQARINTARNLWATTERLDVSNFHQQLPNMAIRYPFELDTFQKEAILHLEKGESVFVSAHTSAGQWESWRGGESRVSETLLMLTSCLSCLFGALSALR